MFDLHLFRGFFLFFKRDKGLFKDHNSNIYQSLEEEESHENNNKQDLKQEHIPQQRPIITKAYPTSS